MMKFVSAVVAAPAISAALSEQVSRDEIGAGRRAG
jgi:hypothetical protein